MCKRIFLVIIMVLAPSLCSSVHAQVPRTSSPKDRAIEDKYRSDEIERVRREASAPEHRPTTRFPQIKDDFERIQLINSEMMTVTASDARIDYERVAEAAGEIKKRATRLKSNLFPSSSRDHSKQIGEQKGTRNDLKFLLSELDKAIITFVHNPIFENTKVVNPQDSARAERELLQIINLSARTRKQAGRPLQNRER